ncbi:ABC transporter ATP-binding protein [Planctomicrobium sp.]|jgi:ABC-2 type transport system ATP-binding protein|nr:ABC transporter ATP-binding protein [Planctomicrobium sp.]
MLVQERTLIKVSEFRKAFDGMLAVDRINFSVQPGEILGLIGPNGAGKTTTLRSLSGLTIPTEGELSVCGFNVEKQPLEVKKRLAYIPDDPPLFPELTVTQHLAFTASVFSVQDATEKSNQLLDIFELNGKRNTRASELSRGMRQKLAICCSYLHNPEVILLDEPMTGLDPHGIRMLKESLQLRAQQGTAVIISSHLLAMVEDICTHVLILKQGEQRFTGTLKELKSMFTADCDKATLEQIFFQATEANNQEIQHETPQVAAL